MAQYRNVKEFTDKIREEYEKAREQYAYLHNKLDRLNSEWQRDLKRGWSDMQLQNEDKAKYESTKEEVQMQIRSLIDESNKKFDEIGAEADSVFSVHNRARGEKLDIATLELLKSGILSDNELKALAKDFDNNITMLRLIGKYAEERASNNNLEMRVLTSACKNAQIPYREPIENLIYWSKQGLRDDRAKSDGIAKVYNEEADKITAGAEKIFIKVDE